MASWEKYEKVINKKQQRAENFWLGTPNRKDGEDEQEYQETSDNLIFEALETFIPIATAERPDPVVFASGGRMSSSDQDREEGESLAKRVRQMLSFKADTKHLKIVIKKVVRNWAIDLIGVVKHGWSEREQDFSTKVIRATKLIFDPTGTIDANGDYTGRYIGEYKEEPASELALRFPNKKNEIKEAVKGKMGSIIRYIEWWTNEYVFWTMQESVLDKAKNPNWNEDTMENKMDEYGNSSDVQVKGKNHFKNKKIPYSFLTVFNLGRHPHDDTSLILQNIPNQEKINDRNKQIEENVKFMNGCFTVSGEMTGMNREEATLAIKTAMRGGGLYISQGDPSKAVSHTSIPPLPSDVYNHRDDMRNELKNIFGTRGSTAGSLVKERTVRGKTQLSQVDASRIGNGIGEHIEQFVDHIYNWWVQMMYVHYDQPQAASVLGQDRSTEYITLKNSDFISDLLVTVKEGSLMPKDERDHSELMKELAAMNKIDDITLYDSLDFPNPRETAKRLWLQNNSPEVLFQNDEEVKSVLQQKQQEAQHEQQAKEQESQSKHDNKVEMEIINHSDGHGRCE